MQLNPKDATTAHCIGVWCKVFAELPWYQQKMASILFAAPPTSSYEQAIEMFQHAENSMMPDLILLISLQCTRALEESVTGVVFLVVVKMYVIKHSKSLVLL